MTKSTDMSVNSVVTLGDNTFTKQCEETVAHGIVHTPETWTDQNGNEYEPSLTFQLGLSEPRFNNLVA